jgi:uncharacterized protein (TIGR03435 family)
MTDHYIRISEFPRARLLIPAPSPELALLTLYSSPVSAAFPGGRLTAIDNALRALIMNANGISAMADLFQGGPAWIDSARYDVEAKADATLHSQ